MFRIVTDPVETTLLDENHAAGGVVTFEGRVRNRNDGREVRALEYEAYPELACTEGERILAEARTRFAIKDAACVHRIGLLNLGEVAIRVEVASAHRREAFEACEFVVDEVKRRVPVWKREHYAEGPSEWINANGRKVVTEEAYYARQMRLPEVGSAGQARLRAARVLMVGAGGLGCPALTYLAAAGVGTIGIVDDDLVDQSNLHRQPLYGSSDVGSPKARRAAERIRSQNPFIEVQTFEERLTPANVLTRIAPYDLVVDGTDNFATKFLLNDACVQAGKPLIGASIHQYEGHVFTVRPEGPCLRCLWPQAPEDGCVGTCAEVGVLGFVPGLLGTLLAAEALKGLLGLRILWGELALVDLLNLGVSRLTVPKEPTCPACGQGASITPIRTLEHVIDSPAKDDLLVDIREPEESEQEPIPRAIRMPMSRFDAEAPELRGGSRVLLVCQRGLRSDRLARELRASGDQRFFSLSGGLRGIDRGST